MRLLIVLSMTIALSSFSYANTETIHFKCESIQVSEIDIESDIDATLSYDGEILTLQIIKNKAQLVFSDVLIVEKTNTVFEEIGNAMTFTDARGLNTDSRVLITSGLVPVSGLKAVLGEFFDFWNYDLTTSIEIGDVGDDDKIIVSGCKKQD